MLNCMQMPLKLASHSGTLSWGSRFASFAPCRHRPSESYDVEERVWRRGCGLYPISPEHHVHLGWHKGSSQRYIGSGFGLICGLFTPGFFSGPPLKSRHDQSSSTVPKSFALQPELVAARRYDLPVCFRPASHTGSYSLPYKQWLSSFLFY